MACGNIPQMFQWQQLLRAYFGVHIDVNVHVVAVPFTCFGCLKICSIFQIVVDDGGKFSLGNWTLSGVESLTKESSKKSFVFHVYRWIPQFEMVQVLLKSISAEWKPLNFGI